jgi:large subunit ribosomal protein L6
MSRVGQAPIPVPKGVDISVSGQKISVKGPKGKLSFDVPEPIAFKVEKKEIVFTRPSDQREHRALHGMARAITANMVRGCSEGFTRVLEIIGVGYRANVAGKKIELALGYSHPIVHMLPDGVTAEATKDGKLILSGADRAVLGQVAADIRAYRPPEPYKGKGIRFAEERVVRKEGKARVKA